MQNQPPEAFSYAASLVLSPSNTVAHASLKRLVFTGDMAHGAARPVAHPLPPSVHSQLGQDNLEHIKAIADNLQGASGAAPAAKEEEDDEGDDGIPDLVDNFEEAA